MFIEDLGYEEDEEWRDIIYFPNYMVSNFGRVWSITTDIFLSLRNFGDGYYGVTLWNEYGKRNFYIHRLVATAFIRPYSLEANEINHDDGDKSYNFVENLEWSTSSDNKLHAYRTGLKSIPIGRSIRIIETGEIFDSQSSCARAIGGYPSAINNCLRGHGRASRHRGYTFEYVD